jgi:hypothetical protein
MDKKITAVLAAGLLVTLLLFMYSVYLAGIAFILLVVIIMSLMISQETMGMPQLTAKLREDAKAIVLTNGGNAPALRIHVALVPLNIEYDVGSLAVDQSHEHPLTSMISDVKAVITYTNERGQSFSHSHKLSAAEEFDPLKPMIPIFGWK